MRGDDSLFDNVDVFLAGDFLKDFWPDGGGDFTDVGFFEYAHKCSRLSDAAADGEWDIAVYNALMVGEF